MTKFSSMVLIMIHGPAVDAPITRGPVPDAGGQLSGYLVPVKKYHLEPQLFPAQIADCIIGVHFHFTGCDGRNFHDFSVHNVGKLRFLDSLHHKVENIL